MKKVLLRTLEIVDAINQKAHELLDDFFECLQRDTLVGLIQERVATEKLDMSEKDINRVASRILARDY